MYEVLQAHVLGGEGGGGGDGCQAGLTRLVREWSQRQSLAGGRLLQAFAIQGKR